MPQITFVRPAYLFFAIFFILFLGCAFALAIFIGYSSPRTENYLEIEVVLPDNHAWEKNTKFSQGEIQIWRLEGRMPCCDGRSRNQAAIIAYFNGQMARLGWSTSQSRSCDAGFPEDRSLVRGRSYMAYVSAGGHANESACVGVLEEGDHYRVIFVTLNRG